MSNSQLTHDYIHLETVRDLDVIFMVPEKFKEDFRLGQYDNIPELHAYLKLHGSNQERGSIKIDPSDVLFTRMKFWGEPRMGWVGVYAVDCVLIRTDKIARALEATEEWDTNKRDLALEDFLLVFEVTYE